MASGKNPETLDKIDVYATEGTELKMKIVAGSNDFRIFFFFLLLFETKCGQSTGNQINTEYLKS